MWSVSSCQPSCPLLAAGLKFSLITNYRECRNPRLLLSVKYSSLQLGPGRAYLRKYEVPQANSN